MSDPESSTKCVMCLGSLTNGGLPLSCCSQTCESCPFCSEPLIQAGGGSGTLQGTETNSTAIQSAECAMCGETVRQDSQETHFCSYQDFGCPFSVLGCHEGVSPDKLEVHLQSGVVHHLHLACIRISELEREAQQQSERAYQLVKEKNILKDELADLKAHPRFQLLLSEIRRDASGENVYTSPRFLDRYSTLRDSPSKLISKLVANGDGNYLVKVLRTLDRKFVDTELAAHSVVELIKIATKLVWDSKKNKTELLSFIPNPGLATELLEYLPNKERTSHSCLSLVTSFTLPIQCLTVTPMRNKWLEVLVALKEMVLYAKLQGNLQLSDNILVHIDLLSDIVKNCEGIDLVVSLPDFLDPSKLRIVRDTLKKNKKYELARDLSLKCGIEVDCVWAEWGLDLIEQGNFREARTKFQRFLVPNKAKTQASPHNPSSHARTFASLATGSPTSVSGSTPGTALGPSLGSEKQRVLESIVKALTTPPFGKDKKEPNPQSKPATASTNVDSQSTEGQENKPNEDNDNTYLDVTGNPLLDQPDNNSDHLSLDANNIEKEDLVVPDENIAECLFYLCNYDTPRSLVEFYLGQERLGLYPAVSYVVKHDLPQEQMDSIVSFALENKKMNELKKILLMLNTPALGAQVSKYLLGMCQYLTKNEQFLELVSLQVFMKDYVRAGLACIRIFIDQYKEKKNLFNYSQHILNLALEYFQEALDNFDSADVPFSVDRSGTTKSDVQKYMKRTQLQLQLLEYLHIDPLSSYKDLIGGAPVDQEKVNGYTLFGSKREQAILAQYLLMDMSRLETALEVIENTRVDKATVAIRAAYCLVQQPLAKFESSFGRPMTSPKKAPVDPNQQRISNKEYRLNEFIAGVRSLLPEETLDKAINAMIKGWVTHHKDNLEVPSRLAMLLTLPESQVEAYIHCNKLKTAYTEAVRLGSTELVERVRTAARKTNSETVENLCAKFLQINQL